MKSTRNLPALPGSTLRDSIILVIVTLACLLPFINKAFNIDDPMYLWAAEHILKHPFDFYGFSVNWEGYSMPMPVVMKNPPGVSYFIALASLVTGATEAGLHAAFLPQAAAAALGTYFLARRLTAYALPAALATVLTPVYLLSGTTIMADMLTLAFWVWAVLLWVRGLERQDTITLAASGLLVAAATLTKYPGGNLIPLLLAYAVFSGRRLRLWAPWIILPVIILALYQWATKGMYGQGLFFAAASYAGDIRAKASAGYPVKGLIGLSFAGGCYITALFFAPLVWRWKALVAGVALFLAVFFLLLYAGGFGGLELAGPRWGLAFQAAVFITAGTGVLALAFSDILKERDNPSLLLFLWVLGTFVFSSFVNWSINGRTMMPMAPAVGILLMRALERRFEGRMNIAAFAPLAPALVVSVMVAWGDYSLANSAREAARGIYSKYSAKSAEAGVGLWFQGHWGLQHYAERAGGRIIDWKSSRIMRGDIVVIPLNNYDIEILPMDRLGLVEEASFPLVAGAATMYPPSGASFYSSRGGPLPYVFGSGFKEIYFVMYAKEDLMLKF